MSPIFFVVLISLVYINLTFGLQNSIIFPGSTRSSISKYEDRISYTDQPRRVVPTPESNFGEWGSETRNVVNKVISNNYPKNSNQNLNPISNQPPKLNPASNQTPNHNSNYNQNYDQNNDQNYDQNQNFKPSSQNPNEMKGISRKNNLNSLSDKGEESRMDEKEKKQLSAFDELPYDFSQTDKIHRVSDLLRFLGIDEKKEDDGLMVRKSNDDPTQVACHTEMRTVDLATELNKSDEEFKLFPQCVKAKRCAGCCGFNSGKVCTPTKKEKINVYAAVIRVKRSCDGALSCSTEIDKDNLRKMFQIDSHEECACKCKINSEECNENQEYDESTCKCQCKDSEGMRSNCEKKAQMKWSDKNCQCECKKVLACSTGLVFSQKTCGCARKGQA